MRVFLAGASGAIGLPLVRALVAAGHQVTALTRSPHKQDDLRHLGATPAVADALQVDALRAAVAAAKPTHVIHQLTALPKDGPSKVSDLIATNRLRIEGTRHLLDASIRAGARRLIIGSFAPLSAAPASPAGRQSPGGDDDALDVNDAGAAVRSMESQALEANRTGKIEAVVLRYGLFYGPENPSTIGMIEMIRKRRLPTVRGDNGLVPFIHIDDAVSATIAALDRGTPGSVYDIVDDRPISISDVVRLIAEYTRAPRPMTVPGWLPRLLMPFRARMISMRLPLSNAHARAELGWRPLYPSWRDGLSKTFSQAA